jgi:hypothetical protein
MSVKITLKKPITAHGKEITEIELREPCGGDVADCGLPFEVSEGANGGSAGRIDTAAVAAYIAKLGNIPPSSVRSLCVPDFSSCMGVVMGFFGDMTPEPSATGTLSSRSSSET